jgi:hypothetical protein
MRRNLKGCLSACSAAFEAALKASCAAPDWAAAGHAIRCVSQTRGRQVVIAQPLRYVSPQRARTGIGHAVLSPTPDRSKIFSWNVRQSSL